MISIRMLSLICLTALMSSVISCKKDSVAISSAVELLSFGPTGAKHGESIRFIGNNLDKVTSIELTGATVESSAFTEQTSELIVIVVPQSTEKGYVTLKTPDGDVVSKTQISFDVAVAIESVTPIARPGDNITITGQYLNWVTQVKFTDDIAVTTFVSRSLTELVVTVPQNAKTGLLVISTGGTEPVDIETETELTVTLPSITSFSPNPIERGTNLTITGTDLDLTMGVLFKGIADPITTFVSQTETELIITVPELANKGKISLVAFSSVVVESAEDLKFIGDLPDLEPLGYAMYEDALVNGWQSWGWGGTIDLASSDNVRDGLLSVKKGLDGGWGAFRLHSDAGIATAGYTEITFSIYGSPGTAGKTFNLNANWGNAYSVAVEEGKWVEFKVPISALGNPGTINDLVMQETGWSGTVYIDHVGLR